MRKDMIGDCLLWINGIALALVALFVRLTPIDRQTVGIACTILLVGAFVDTRNKDRIEDLRKEII